MQLFRCFCFVILLFSIVGCVSADRLGSAGEELVFQATSNGEVPWNVSSTYSAKAPLFRAIFTQPLYRNSDFEIVKGLFQDWVWNPRSQSFVVTIDRKYLTTDQRAIVSSDIEFALVKFYISKDRGEFTAPHYLDSLKGIKKLTKDVEFKSGLCECFRVISDFKFEIFIDKKDPKFIESFADFYYPITKPDQFDEGYFRFDGVPIGSGPYYISDTDLEKGQLTLKLRDKYLPSRVMKTAPKKVLYHFAGSDWEHGADVSSGRGSERLRESKDYRIINTPYAYAAFLISFNFENRLGRQLNFRKAVSLAIDREALNPGEPGVQPYKYLYLNSKLGIQENVEARQPKVSREIVDQLLLPKIDGSKPLKAIYFSSYKRERDPDFVLKLEEQFASVGLKIDIEQSDFRDIKKGNHSDVAFYIKGKGFPVDDILFPLYFYLEDDDQSLTYDRSNRKIIDLYLRAKSEPNYQEKKRIAQELVNHLNENVINVTLDKRHKVYLVHKKVKSVGLDNPEGVIDFSQIVMK